MTHFSFYAEETCLNNQASPAAATPAAVAGTRSSSSPISQQQAACTGDLADHGHAQSLTTPWGATLQAGSSSATVVAEPESARYSSDFEKLDETDDDGRAAVFMTRGRPLSLSPAASSAGSLAEAENAAPISRTRTAPSADAVVTVPTPIRLARTATGFGNTGAGNYGPNQGRVHSPSPSERSLANSALTADYTPRITFPEGGLQGWLVVFGSFCAMFSVFGLINTAAVFESWFSTHQLAKYSASEIGWIFSLYLFFVFFVGIQVGPIFDAYGPRWLVAVGSLLMVASIMLLGFCEEYYQILLCYSVLGGLGGALLNTPAYACIAHYFNVRRGLATGIALTSGGIGGIMFPLLLQRLLPQLGFAWSTRILGFILLVLAVPANLWLKTRLPLTGAAPASSLENGAAADGSAKKLLSVWPDFTIFRDKCYAVATVGIFFMEWGIFVPLTFIVSYASAHNQDTSASYTMLSLLNAGSVLGRFLPCVMADKFGRFNVIIITIAMSWAVVFGLWMPAGDSHSLLTAFAVLFGFASGSNLGLVAVCLGQLCEPSQYGRYFSTAMMVASFGTLSSVPIGGALLGTGLVESGWKALIAFSGASYFIAMICYIAARIMAVGSGLKTIF